MMGRNRRFAEIWRFRGDRPLAQTLPVLAPFFAQIFAL